MSAPPGWHPQPDGRDRWWDGEQWTEHFRDPVGEGATQTLPAGGAGGYQGAGPGWQPPQKQGMSRGLKGCLITGVVVGMVFKISQDILAPVSSLYSIDPVWAALVPIMICMFLGGWLIKRAG